jgi:hypothetical protein
MRDHHDFTRVNPKIAGKAWLSGSVTQVVEFGQAVS